MKPSNKTIFSVIIPVRVRTAYLKETLFHLKRQTFKSFEILVITDKISKSANPAQKRNLGAAIAKGQYLAFLDDDSYPDSRWLENANKIFSQYHYAAVCGPCQTPNNDNLYQQASGLVLSSLLGSGGAGVYRNLPSSARFVDDYPSVNLLVNRQIFLKAGGFNTHHWPGEDTILCLNLVHQLHQQIYYHPSVVVFHHRRPIIVPHLKQITRYALHRGNFARIYPKTSFRPGYLIPSLYVFYLITLPLTYSHNKLFILPLFLYLMLLFFTLLKFIISGHNLYLALISVITITLTHIYYGILFLIGFFSKKLDFRPHQSNKTGYVGG